MQMLGTMILSFLITITGGYVLSLLWGWFLVPLGVPPIFVVQAIGIMIICSFIKNKKAPNMDDEKEVKALYMNSVANVVAAFILGYVVHLFM